MEITDLAGFVPDAIVFDMDDTLYPEQEYIRSGYRAVAERLSNDSLEKGKIFDMLWDIFSHDPREKVFNTVLDRLGYDQTPELIQVLIRLYREHIPDIKPSEGVVELLGYLSGKYKLGLITDGYMPGQQNKVNSLGVGGFFDSIVFTEELGREFWKPAAMGFEMTAERLGVSHNKCVYIGDNLKKDFVAPNALGWKTIFYKADFQVHKECPVADGGDPQFSISDLQRLREIF